MFPLCPPGNADQNAARIHIPIGRAKAGKGRHQIYACGILDLLRIILRILRFIDKAHLVSQPLDNGPSYKNTPLQRILDFSIEANGYGRKEPMLADIRGSPVFMSKKQPVP